MTCTIESRVVLERGGPKDRKENDFKIAFLQRESVILEFWDTIRG